MYLAENLLRDKRRLRRALAQKLVSKATAPVGQVQSSSREYLNSAAFNTFRNADIRGQGALPGAQGSSGETELMTVHQNTITNIRPYEGEPGRVTKVSTSGVDGNLVIWNASAVSNVTARLGSVQLR